MSLITGLTGAHLVTVFDSAKSAPLTGQRLAKCRYKTTAKQAAKFPSVCVSVPYLTDAEIEPMVPALLGHIRGMLETAQDGVIRTLYEIAGGKLTGVTDSEISIAACIAWMEQESTGSRLTKEYIDSWFNSSVEDYLTVIIGQKLGFISESAEGEVELTTEQEATISRHVSGYKGMYSALAGGKTSYTPNQATNLIKVLNLIDTDPVQEKLLQRLNGMVNRPKIEELLEL